jgi:hypothetical protein
MFSCAASSAVVRLFAAFSRIHHRLSGMKALHATGAALGAAVCLLSGMPLAAQNTPDQTFPLMILPASGATISLPGIPATSNSGAEYPQSACYASFYMETTGGESLGDGGEPGPPTSPFEYVYQIANTYSSAAQGAFTITCETIVVPETDVIYYSFSLPIALWGTCGNSSCAPKITTPNQLYPPKGFFIKTPSATLGVRG